MSFIHDEMRAVLLALGKAKHVVWDYSIAPLELVKYWEQQGAKKGDAVIVAHLQANQVRYLISENRHFLREIPRLPFTVLASAEVVDLLATP